MTWQEDYGRDLVGVFGRPQRELVRGEGCYVWDQDGNRYLDLLAGIAVNALGHAHPALIEAVSTQVATLAHVSNFFASPPQLELAAALKKYGDFPEGSKVFFTNSGAEANEAAIKIALRHRPGGRLIALENAFHGRTLGALSITYKSQYREPFEPMTGNTTFVPANDIDALAAELDETVAAVFMEVIQGEAGVRSLDPEYLTAAQQLAHDAGALLVIDEVQTGVGRTGTWFAHEGIVEPDLVTMAKGLAGGVPIGAVIARPSAADALSPGQHGTTFGGNPLAAAAALAVTREVHALLPHIAELGESWRADLAKVPGVLEVRGAGLLIAVDLDRDAAPVQAALLDAGLITNAVASQTIRLAPPLIITAEQAAEFTTTLRDVLEAANEGDNS
ncbi:acetylornithine aminotransferase apoenzyme [Ruaniaceae bacterium KH17]|nr:acetylornithine aminotransferase apoenzyme [Ruaniaceae bacterium KH17]